MDYNTQVRKIFDDQSITNFKEYHISTYVERRLAINEDGFMEYAHVPFPIKQNSFLQRLFQYAPYEADLIDRIFKCQSRFFFLQGGTGCGKSSCFRFLENECNKLTPDSWRQDCHLTGFIKRVDLQFCNGFLISDEKRRLADSQLSFLDRVSDLLYRSIIELIDTDLNSAKRKIGYQLININSQNRQISRVLGRLRNLTSLSEFSENDDISCFSNDNTISFDCGHALLERINASHGSTKFELLIDLLVFISLWTRPTEDLIICFDNVDRLQKPFLDALISHLIVIDQPDYRAFSRLKLMLYVRLSTVRDGASAFPRIVVKHSSSLSPIQAVLMRIINYLLSSDRTLFYTNDAPAARRLDANLLEVIIRILEPLTSLRTLLEAISGSNIRRAFIIMQRWLSEDRFTSSRFSPDEMLLRLPSSITTTIAHLWLRDQLTSWFETCLLYINNYSDINSLFHKTHIDKRLLEDLSTIFDSADHSSSNNLLSKLIVKHQDVNALVAYLNELCKHDSSLIIRVADISCVDNYKRFMGHILNSFCDSQNMLCKKLPEIWHAARLVEKHNHEEHTSSWEIMQNLSARLRRDLKRPLKITRYAMSVEMLDSIIADRAIVRPYNIIFGTDRSISLNALWICSIIYGQYKGDYFGRPIPYISGRNIATIMERFGVDEDKTCAALRDLTRQKHRLIFSSIHDKEYLTTGTRWKEQEFYLTWSGFSYMENMMDNLYFIEWCLLSHEIIRNNYFPTLKSIDDEKHIFPDEDDEMGVSARNIKTIDAFTGTMKALLHIITDIEKQHVNHCFSEKGGVLPFVPMGTPMIRICVNVYLQIKIITGRISNKIPPAVKDTIDAEIENFSNQILDYSDLLKK